MTKCKKCGYELTSVPAIPGDDGSKGMIEICEICIACEEILAVMNGFGITVEEFTNWTNTRMSKIKKDDE